MLKLAEQQTSRNGNHLQKALHIKTLDHELQQMSRSTEKPPLKIGRKKERDHYSKLVQKLL
jgi:hypothetical protein